MIKESNRSRGWKNEKCYQLFFILMTYLFLVHLHNYKDCERPQLQLKLRDFKNCSKTISEMLNKTAQERKRVIRKKLKKESFHSSSLILQQCHTLMTLNSLDVQDDGFVLNITFIKKI